MGEMLDNRVRRLYGKIGKHIKVCFFSALICGLIAHMYALTNHLYNYDELWHTPTGFGTGVQMGRWGLSVLAWITKVLFKDVYTIPLINGLISIIMYAFMACIVVDLLDVRECVFAGIIGALVTTFPSVVSRMFYMFTTHYYAIGEFLVAVGAMFLVRKSKSAIAVIFSVMLLVFGTSIYQATFVTAVCIVVAVLLVDLISNDYKLVTAVKKSFAYFAYLGISMGLYFISNKVALAVTGLKMDKHSENYDTMGQISMEQLLRSIGHCYKSFLKAGFRDVYSMNPNLLVRLAFLISVLIMVYVGLYVCFSKSEVSQKILIILVIAVLPIAVNLVYIMAASAGVMYSIMTFDMVFILIIPVAMIEALKSKYDIDYGVGKILKICNSVLKGYIMPIVLGMTILSFIWFANGNYLAMQYTNQHDNAYYQTLMTQMKSIDGYEPDMPIAMIGKPVADSSFARQDMIGNTFSLGGKGHTNIAAYSSWNIMTRVLGYDPEVRDSDEDEEYFRGLEEVKSMPCYPSSGAIKIIDDTIVIKFQEVEDLKK